MTECKMSRRVCFLLITILIQIHGRQHLYQTYKIIISSPLSYRISDSTGITLQLRWRLHLSSLPLRLRVRLLSFPEPLDLAVSLRCHHHHPVSHVLPHQTAQALHDDNNYLKHRQATEEGATDSISTSLPGNSLERYKGHLTGFAVTARS